MKHETRIPFSGFYNSLWSGEIDSVEEQEIEHLLEEHEMLTTEQAGDLIRKYSDYSAIFNDVAVAYVAAFEDWLKSEHSLDIKLHFRELQSPREYNFRTDHLFAGISRADLQKLYDHVGIDAIRESAKRNFTSRSGFISFYSNDPDEWGEFGSWDYHMNYCLLDALVESTEDWDWSIYYAMQEDTYNLVSNNIDWPRLEIDIEALENDEVIDDGRRFPKGSITNPALYVKTFADLNHLV